MKTSIGAALAAHQQGSTVTLVDLYKVTRADGQVFGFCALDTDLIYGGITYAARGAWSASSVSQDTGLTVGNLEISGYLSGDSISQADAEAGVWDHARVELLRVNYADLTQGAEIIAVGELGEVRMMDGQLVVELRGFLQRLQNEQGRVFLPTCDLELGSTGDFKCNVNLANFTFAGTVTAMTDRAHFTASALAQATDYFRYGVVTWTSGANNGRRMEVKNFTTGGIFELQIPMSSAIAIGDGFNVSAGCDKMFATCKAKFANAVNFAGFHLIPGLSKLIAGK